MRRPVILSAKPRRTVSTSGSSGMGSICRCGGASAVRGYGAGRAPRSALAEIRLSSCPMSEKETSRDAGGETDFGFRRVPKEEKAPLVRAVFDSVAGRYDLMNDLMSGFVHRRWKDELVRWLAPRPGQTLLDVAGGTGDIACRALKRLAPERGGGVIVCDVNERMLDSGRARAIDDGILS